MVIVTNINWKLACKNNAFTWY